MSRSGAERKGEKEKGGSGKGEGIGEMGKCGREKQGMEEEGRGELRQEGEQNEQECYLHYYSC